MGLAMRIATNEMIKKKKEERKKYLSQYHGLFGTYEWVKDEKGRRKRVKVKSPSMFDGTFKWR